jgi:vacuolar protein-sorting-associated protein 4
MQGLATKNTQLLVIGATNLPWMLDPAVRRRFEKRIYVPLPAIEARSDMFNKGLQRNSHTLTANEITELATT